MDPEIISSSQCLPRAMALTRRRRRSGRSGRTSFRDEPWGNRICRNLLAGGFCQGSAAFLRQASIAARTASGAGLLGAPGRRREHSEDAVAEELQDLAVALGDRIADAFEMLIEPAHDLRPWKAVDEGRKASEISKQQGRRDNLAVAATDPAI
jgi:hypothetical protein